MNEEMIRSAVAAALKSALGMTPEEFQNERRKAKEDAEQKNASVRQYTITQELTMTSDAYLKTAKHVIDSDAEDGLGLVLGRYIRCAAGAAKRGISPQDYAVKAWGDKWLADEFDAVKQKVMSSDVDSAGGFLVPDQLQRSVIQLLRNRTVVRRSGVPTVPMRNGSLTIPKQTSASSAAYVGELQRIDPSEPAFGQIHLQARKLAALVPISNDLLRESDPSADRLVRDDLVRVMALREDLAFLRGVGTAFEPQGLRNWVASGNVINSAGTTLDNKTTDLFDAILQLKEQNVDLFNAVWYISVRTESNLARTRDANGNFAFKSEMDGGKLLGWPFYSTNQIPTNLGGSNSEIYFLETSQALIADAMQLELEVQPNGTYTTASGQVVSGMSNDLTVLRAISKHDFALRYDVACSIVDAVAY